MDFHGSRENHGQEFWGYGQIMKMIVHGTGNVIKINYFREIEKFKQLIDINSNVQRSMKIFRLYFLITLKRN